MKKFAVSKCRFSEQRGSITLIEFTVASTLGLVFILAIVGFKSSITTNSKRDICVMTGEIDLANPDLTPATHCKAYGEE